MQFVDTKGAQIDESGDSQNFAEFWKRQHKPYIKLLRRTTLALLVLAGAIVAALFFNMMILVATGIVSAYIIALMAKSCLHLLESAFNYIKTFFSWKTAFYLAAAAAIMQSNILEPLAILSTEENIISVVTQLHAMPAIAQVGIIATCFSVLEMVTKTIGAYLFSELSPGEVRDDFEISESHDKSVTFSYFEPTQAPALEVENMKDPVQEWRQARAFTETSINAPGVGALLTPVVRIETDDLTCVGLQYRPGG